MNKDLLFKNVDTGEWSEHYPEKRSCTSAQFKLDLFEFFDKDEFKDMTALEVGIYGGYTTKILSYLFKKVYAFDNFAKSITGTKRFNSDRSNIEYKLIDVYKETWPEIEIDVVFIDCVHTTPNTTMDIDNSIKHRKGDEFYLIFDDYANWPAVRTAVDNHKKIKLIKGIGMDIGKIKEGVVCKYIGEKDND